LLANCCPIETCLPSAVGFTKSSVTKLFLVLSSYFWLRLFSSMFLQVSISFILIFTASVFCSVCKVKLFNSFLFKTSSKLVCKVFRSVRVQNPYLTHACKMLHALQNCNSKLIFHSCVHDFTLSLTSNEFVFTWFY